MELGEMPLEWWKAVDPDEFERSITDERIMPGSEEELGEEF